MIKNKINFYSNPYNIFFLLIFVAIINILMPIHFISILLAGVVFISFIQTVENKNWYSLVFVILSFVIIEISHGLYLFSLSLLSLFIYAFVIPRLKYLLSSKNIFIGIVLFIYYILVFILFTINSQIKLDIAYKILINYIIDIIIVGIL